MRPPPLMYVLAPCEPYRSWTSRARSRRSPRPTSPSPSRRTPLTPGSGVLVDVHAAGVSFPEVLQTRGEYQIKPPLPFVPGSEVAGTVRSAPEGSASARATASPRAACWGVRRRGRGAGLPHVPALGRARLRAGRGPDPQLPHRLLLAEAPRPSRGGRDRARPRRRGRRGHGDVQVAKGLGARTIAVVSSDEKERVAREAGRGRGGPLGRRLEGRGEGAVRAAGSTW